LLQQGFVAEEVKDGSREVLVAEILSRMNESVMTSQEPVFGMYHAGEDRSFLMTLKNKVEAYSVLSAKAEVLRDLDVVVLSELLIGDLLGLDHSRILKEKLVSYYSDPDDAIDVAVKKSIDDESHTPLLFLLNPTRVHQVTKVADSGQIMPHKSTYFYPKIVTGLLINKLVEGERISLPEQAK